MVSSYLPLVLIHSQDLQFSLPETSFLSTAGQCCLLYRNELFDLHCKSMTGFYVECNTGLKWVDEIKGHLSASKTSFSIARGCT